jgi:hypothetical protein
MISKQFSLINFSQKKSEFAQFCELLHGSNLNFNITENNILHVNCEECPDCGTQMVYNGSYTSSSLYYRSQSVYFKVGQQFCPNCQKTRIPKNKFIQIIASRTNHFLECQMVSLSEKGLSCADISLHLKETFGIKISSEHVSNTIENHIMSIDIAPPIVPEKGWFCYDEQHLKENKKTIYRIVIYHPKTLEVIYEKDHKVLNQIILESLLQQVFKGVKPIGFTFDMAPSYPKVFQKVFGKNLKMQWCLFHLNQLIFKEVKKYRRIGSKLVWNLEDIHQIYDFFNIFYERKTSIEYIVNLKERLRVFKEFIKDKVKNETTEILNFEKKLIKEFFSYQHQLKLMRKRNGETLRLISRDEALTRVQDLFYKKRSLIKPLESRIVYIKDNFERFVASLECEDSEHTNNKLEGKFGVTLRKTEKIKFRSRNALVNCLKLKQLRNRGALFIEPSSMLTLALISTVGCLCGIFV